MLYQGLACPIVRRVYALVSVDNSFLLYYVLSRYSSKHREVTGITALGLGNQETAEKGGNCWDGWKPRTVQYLLRSILAKFPEGSILEDLQVFLEQQ